VRTRARGRRPEGASWPSTSPLLAVLLRAARGGQLAGRCGPLGRFDPLTGSGVYQVVTDAVYRARIPSASTRTCSGTRGCPICGAAAARELNSDRLPWNSHARDAVLDGRSKWPCPNN
jgi:hypothetical protein